MTTPLQPPQKKNPQRRTVTPTRPPESRSRAALGLTAAAAEGRFALQTCADCGAVQYPPRDACCACLSVALDWRDVSPMGRLIAETRIRATTNPYFRDRLPWRTGTVQLEIGPSVICHVHGDCVKGTRVELWNRLDRAGQGVLIAMPETPTPQMRDDPQLRAMTSDPKYRRVLITDGRSPNAPALARALKAAGAAAIYVGEAETWRPYPERAQLEALGVEFLELDVTDTASVNRMAAEYGGKVDILINNARFLRPGGVLARGDTGFARDEIEVNYLGLMRLAQGFGPAMCGRTDDGVNSAVAWVNILAATSLCNSPEMGCFSASQAAARSLTQSLRGEFRAAGLRVMNVYVGPTEDDWHQPLPPPKVAPTALARAVVGGLQDGLEEVYCGDIAQDMALKFQRNPKVLERELTMGGEA